MALVFYCPHCGGQNFVAPERLKHREKAVVCWICNEEIPWDFLERLEDRSRDEKEEKGGKE